MVTAAAKTEPIFPGGKFNNAQLEVLKLNENLQEEISAKISSGEIDLQTIQNPDLHYRSHV